jgi:hypothetical protein
VSLSPEDFHVEHVVARKHGGGDNPENLAWACIFCNLYKGPNPAGFDPDTGKLTPLFHPRKDRWEEHFRLEGAQIIGLTDVGRTTVWVLGMNSDILSSLRASLVQEGRW